MNDTSVLSTILGAALGAFLAWAMIRVVTYYVIRLRLKSYIVTVTNIYLKQLNANREWIEKYAECMIFEGCVIDGAPFYTRDDFEDLRNINVDNMLYLRRSEQIQLTNLIANMSEAEALFEGFCKSLMELQKDGQPLSKVKSEFMKVRSERIVKLANQFPRTIESIEKLRFGYNKDKPKQLVEVLKEKTHSRVGKGESHP